MTLHDIAQQLAAQFGLPPLIPDRHGLYALGFDGLVVNFHGRPDGESFTVRSCLGRLAGADFPVHACALLAANLADGPCYCAIDTAGMAYLTAWFHLPSLAFGTFLQALERFVGVAEAWRQRLAATSTPAVEA